MVGAPRIVTYTTSGLIEVLFEALEGNSDSIQNPIWVLF